MEFEIPSVVFNTLNFENEINQCVAFDAHNFILAFKICILGKFGRETFERIFELCVKKFTFHIDSFEVRAGVPTWGIALYTKTYEGIWYHKICTGDIRGYGLNKRSIIDWIGEIHYVRGDIFDIDEEMYCPKCFTE